jgi:hypothetical protein
MRKKAARRSPARRTVSCAPQDSGLIVDAQTLKQSARTKSALDNRSHRTPEFSSERINKSAAQGAAQSLNRSSASTNC